MSTAIKVENLSKAYRIGQIGTGTISQDIERWWITKVMRREDPFLKLGETNDRTRRGESNVVWSLKDINFEVEQGEAVGIIGRNGAGKSTLLKILSRVTAPTTGSVKIKGRVASLLEVGTGFHPELTGRENIYLNGSILGMRKREIDRKLDEIIDFSGVERYIDTPVKRYSSGMSVRLAFAVAAHLESEILIVDEVLAVGDAEFQQKCLGKMDEISHEDGRTILFVSHNLAAVTSLCNSSIVLCSGQVTYQGDTQTSVSSYLWEEKNDPPTFPLHLESMIVDKFAYEWADPLHRLMFSITAVTSLRFDYYVKVSVRNTQDEIIFENSKQLEINQAGEIQEFGYQSDFEFLQNGEYKIYLSVFEHGVRWLVRDQFLMDIKIYLPNVGNLDHLGVIAPMGEWVC